MADNKGIDAVTGDEQIGPALESTNGTGTKKRGRAVKSTLSHSPLARPNAEIYKLASDFQDFMYMPDPSPLYVVLGTLAANMISGDAVWTMLVGPASCGKTEVIMSTVGISKVKSAGEVTSQGAFLSGVSDKDKDKGATGGLLLQIGARGALLFEDFTTSVMKLEWNTRNQVVGAMRRIYNGYFDRSVGSGGARRLEWKGKIAVLAGGTFAIDRQQSEMAELGERWLYYRYDGEIGDDGDYGASQRGLRNKIPESVRKRMRERIKEFFDARGLDWGCEGEGVCDRSHMHLELIRRDLQPWEEDRLIAMAQLMSVVRSTVHRDRNGEIDEIPRPSEVATRMAKALGQLYTGLEAIGLSHEDCWRLVGRVAMDSGPDNKVFLLKKFRQLSFKGVEGLSAGQLAKSLHCGVKVVKRALEDLAIYKVVRKMEPVATEEDQEGKGEVLWGLTDWAWGLLETGWDWKK